MESTPTRVKDILEYARVAMWVHVCRVYSCTLGLLCCLVSHCPPLLLLKSTTPPSLAQISHSPFSCSNQPLPLLLLKSATRFPFSCSSQPLPLLLLKSATRFPFSCSNQPLPLLLLKSATRFPFSCSNQPLPLLLLNDAPMHIHCNDYLHKILYKREIE